MQKPVPWEEIERMSLCSPLWGDDKDSDISEPDSQDRVTIYTTDLSPTPSELACLQQVQSLLLQHSCCACYCRFHALCFGNMLSHLQAESQSELWGTPRSRLSMPKVRKCSSLLLFGTRRTVSAYCSCKLHYACTATAMRAPQLPVTWSLLCLQDEDTAEDVVAGTPPSPFSPWAPWGTAKASFADALRSPVAMLDLEVPAGSIPLSSKISSAAPTQDAPAKATDAAPATFGDAFAQGMLRNITTKDAGPSTSLFGQGLRSRDAPAVGGSVAAGTGAALTSGQNFIADEDLGAECNSISMKAMPKVCAWDGSGAPGTS
jgi:hypothetical protein